MAGIGLIRRFLWIAPVVLGLVFIAAGAYMIVEGRQAKEQVQSSLVAEQVVTSKDASIPNAPVVDASTAQAQADAIQHHTLALENGKTYSQMSKTDPNRATYLNGVALRTALDLAVMGFKVSDLVIGLGAFIVVAGLANIFLLAPVMYWLREPAAEREAKKARASRQATEPLAG